MKKKLESDSPLRAATCSPLAAALSMVRHYNRWRRGDDDESTEYPASPREIGSAIDAVCDAVERLEAERDQWKANHDNQVEIKRIIAARPDLKDRAPRVEKLMSERNRAQGRSLRHLERVKLLEAWIRERCPKADILPENADVEAPKKKQRQ